MKPASSDFRARNRRFLQRMARDASFRELSLEWFLRSFAYEYSYHFTWLGRPIIQYPQDLVALQEIVWKVKPDLIIETGIARGGSLIFYASLLHLIGNSGRVIGIDIKIRKHNRTAVLRHPMSSRILMIEGSSVSPDMTRRVRALARRRSRVMVVLDSCHTHQHVLEELRAYAPLVTKGSYLVVLDTVVEDLPARLLRTRPWGRGNNPRTALREYLRETSRFVPDPELDSKLAITTASGGYLKCVKD